MKNNVGKLYLIELSPSVRAVLLCARGLNIEFEQIRLNLFSGDHHKAEFTSINPLHTVPTYVDNDGIVIADSHAIMCYLVDKYGKEDSLYPQDLSKRALVNQRLFFNCGNFSIAHQQFYFPMWTKEGKTPAVDIKKRATECYEYIEKILKDKQYVAGDNLTIADFSLIGTLSSFALWAPVDPKLEALLKWIKRVEELPYYEEANGRYVKAYKRILDDLCEHQGEIHVEWLPEP